MQDKHFLSNNNAEQLGEFLFEKSAGVETLRVLESRKPNHPSPLSLPHTQTAEAFLRQGYELCLKELRSLPTDRPPVEEKDPVAIALDPQD